MWSVFKPISKLGQHKSALLATRCDCAVSIWLMLTLPPQTGVKWLSPVHSWEGYKAACKILTQPSTWLTAQQQHCSNSMICPNEERVCVYIVCAICFWTHIHTQAKNATVSTHHFYKCEYDMEYAFNFHNVMWLWVKLIKFGGKSFMAPN